MLKEERHSIILQELRGYNRLKATYLCKKLQVSEDTIRRDLKELAEQGHLKKVHGGAISLTYIPSFKKREVQEIQIKHQIARKALPLIEEGQVLIIDGGTTNLQLVNILPLDINLTIFTNSIPVASRLCEYKNIDGVLLGGNILKKGFTTIGYHTMEILKEINADLCFLGVTSLDIERGLTEDNREETLLKKAIINASGKVASLVISHKLGTSQNFKVADINRLNILISELESTDEILDPFRKKGMEIL